MKIKHVFLLAILVTVFPLHINAATITVTNTNDSGSGSLRQALADAAPGDTIDFSVKGTITLTTGLLFIDKSLTIQGPEASMLSISGNNASGVVFVNVGVTAVLDGITITGGYSPFGGGIRNNGTLSVSNSVVSGNNAPDNGFLGYGGGIVNSGWLEISNSTISNNQAYLYGGGIYNSSTLKVINSTISSNNGSGGGISQVGQATIVNSTISGNAGGGISSIPFAGTTTETLINTIVAGNDADINTIIESASHNLVGNAGSSGGIQNGVNGNIVGVNPLLGPLQSNGGPTMTQALLPGSPAMNAGDNALAIGTTDQRGAGFARIVSGTVDIGAFELQATITVTNTNDSGPGSLRQAIEDATPGYTINFSGGISGGTITLTSGELVIDKNLTIQGPGTNPLSISGNNASRVFFINSGVTTTLDGMTIRNGFSNYGAGIVNQGTLTVSNSSIFGNYVSECQDVGCASIGGGIYNSVGSTLTVTRSTISGNVSAEYGCGISNGGILTVNNSTISDNATSSPSGSYSGGGGIFNYGTLTVNNSTISDNTALEGGGIYHFDGTETIVNTIVSGNAGLYDNPSDIYGQIEIASHNLIGDAGSSGGIQNGVNGNIVGVDPLLGPLQNNGGQTMTHALLPGSPAINAASNCVLTVNGCGNGNPGLPTDQRGMPRNGTVDIGAFERQLEETPSTVPFDFDGDGRSDVSVFRPSDSVWYLDRSTEGFSATQFGLSSDKLTPADYDGDGKTDISVFRNGDWYWLSSSNGVFNTFQFGLASDVSVPADYSGDGRSDLAVYRNGTWWTFDLATQQASAVQFGIAADKPVVADYDGDGRADQAVYRGDGEWHINRSTQGYAAVSFGLATDRPVPADYDGDGKADQGVYRDGTWYLLQSGQGFTALQFGIAADTPAPADYDGDGRTDAAVYRDGTWYLLQTTSGFSAQQFGLANDLPVPAAFLP